MAQLVKFYTDTIKERSGGFYGAWPVDSSIKLGDYGKSNGNQFMRYGNVKDDFNINITRQTGKGRVKTYSFKAGEKVNVITNSGGLVGSTSATMEISFGGESGVYFSIDGCKYSEVRNYQELGEKIIEVYSSNKWQDEFVIVTDLVTADASTIVVTNGKNATIKLEANVSTISESDCVNSNINFNIVSQNNIGLNIIAENNLIPLIGLSNIKASFISSPEWGKCDIKKKSGIKRATSYLKKIYYTKRRKHSALRGSSANHMVASISLLENEKVIINNFLSEKFIQKELKCGQYRRPTRSSNIIFKKKSVVEPTRSNAKQIRNALIRNQASRYKTSSLNNKNMLFYGNKEYNQKARLVTFQKI